MQKTIYIGGKVTGLSRAEATGKFGTAQKKLMNEGHITVVPLDIVENNSTWEDAMKVCIPALLKCDELHLLPNWNESKGAMLERDIALRLGMPIVYLK